MLVETFVNSSSKNLAIDAFLAGEVIEKFEGEIRYDKLSKESQDKYSTYFEKDKVEPFPLEDFEKLTKLYFSVDF